MRIDTATVLTVSALRALIADAPDNASIEWAKTPKKLLTGECWCGCGATTKSRFAPGHDSKFHSLAKQVARGIEDMPESFVNEDAEADFMKWHDAEVPKHEARVMEKLAKAATKAVAKAAKETAKTPKVKKVAKEAVARKVEKPVPVVVGERFAKTEALDKDSQEYKDLVAMVTMS